MFYLQTFANRALQGLASVIPILVALSCLGALNGGFFGVPRQFVVIAAVLSFESSVDKRPTSLSVSLGVFVLQDAVCGSQRGTLASHLFHDSHPEENTYACRALNGEAGNEIR